MDYGRLIDDALSKQPLIRHLWSRIGTEITVVTVTGRLKGILRSIDLAWKWIEVDSPARGKTFFINSRHIVMLETAGTEDVVRGRV